MAFVFSSSFCPPAARLRASPPLCERRSANLVMAADEGGNGIGRKLAAVALAALLVLPSPMDALAASSSGRVGGRSFSAPRSAPSRTYNRGGSYGGGYGGGYSGGYFSPVMPVSPFFYSPFSAPVVMFGGGGGGGLIGTAVVLGGAYVLLRSLQFRNDDDNDEVGGGPRSTAVVTLKLGLLASATRVRESLDSLAMGGDTSTAAGLARVLSDACVSLLRSSDYWVSGATDLNVTRGRGAEQTFNEVSVRERSKLAKETLSNVAGERRSVPVGRTPNGDPEEYVVVTLVAAVDSSVAAKLPRQISSSSDVRKVLTALSGVYGDQMQALEVLWAPQARGDSMSRAEMLLDHPELRSF